MPRVPTVGFIIALHTRMGLCVGFTYRCQAEFNQKGLAFA